MPSLVVEVPTLTGMTWEAARQLREHDEGCRQCQVGGVVYPNARLEMEVGGGTYRTETGGTKVREVRCVEGDRLERLWVLRRDLEDAPVRGEEGHLSILCPVPVMSFGGWKSTGGRG